ncbi:MAG: hypothetical protein EBR82_21920 [Caulobacteraceae bacterium]|nr:hypothetical protein [Caulobacteraceae bacterium]
MPAPVIKGSSVSFGIANAESTMVATNISANGTSNKVEAKNIQGGTAAVAYTGKKTEYTIEGFVTATNSVTQGGSFQPANLAGLAGQTGGYYVEEVTFTASSEDFSKIRYRVVQRDGIT